MTDDFTTDDFRAAPGVGDWKVQFTGPQTHYPVSDLSTALVLATAVVEAAEATGVLPDIDLRPEGVTIVIRHDVEQQITAESVDFAQRVSAAAHDMGLSVDVHRIQSMQIGIAQGAGVDVQRFWVDALGYRVVNEEDAIDPIRRGPVLHFHALDSGATGRGRTHIDVSLPAGLAESRVNAALAAGGRLAPSSNAPAWWSLASSDNHGLDIAAWPDTDGYT